MRTMPNVHPSALVSDQAELAPDSSVGPNCILEGPVTLGPGVRLIANVYCRGPARIGAGTTVYPTASLGLPAQHRAIDHDTPTAGIEIGQRCVIREQVTVHAATNDETPTIVGNDVYMMVGSHAGHDARVDDRVTMVNHAVLGGHAHVAEGANLGGLTAIHQHGRVGRLALISGGVACAMDVPPFCLVAERNRVCGINVVGMRRAGIPGGEITATREAFRRIFKRVLTTPDTIAELEQLAQHSECVGELRDFFNAAGHRTICVGPARPPRNMIPFLRELRKGNTPAGVLDDAEDSA
jgi:UDP-N-acetylglucosamine acyltransferase